MGQTQYLLGAKNWARLQSIGCVESERRIKGNSTLERRYYLLSIPSDAQLFAGAVRSHWGIENQLHWILDVGFREDGSRACQVNSAENMAVVRHIAVNLLSQEKSVKVGVKAKRLRAGWDDDYLLKVLSQPAGNASKL
jgi:predicted transposase YbfD/YdcC